MLAGENHMRLRRVMSLAAAGLALGALLLLSASVQAAGRAAGAHAPALAFSVNSFLDAPDDTPGDGLCRTSLAGHPCTLRAAVQELDHQASGGGINLPAGTYTLTDDADGDLQLQKNIAIAGSGLGFTLIHGKPGWAARIFRVQAGAQASFSGLAISGGHPAAGLDGGGIDVVSGTLTLQQVLVYDNAASRGGGIANHGVLNLDQTQILANLAYSQGAGIDNEAPLGAIDSLDITSSFFAANFSQGPGGGLYNVGAMTLLSDTLEFNTAQTDGGGLDNASGGGLIEHSTFFDNQSINGSGGGIENVNPGSGLELINSTIASNTAALAGGGIASQAGDISLASVTVAYNLAHTGLALTGGGGGLYSHATAFAMKNTLVADNLDGHHLTPDCDGTFDSGGYNLVRSISGCGGLIASDLTGQDPQLLPLAGYGGPTLTYALPSTSPAVDAGNPAGCPVRTAPLLVDQRGQPRPTDGNGDGVARCDIGAFELQLQRVFLPLAAR